MTIALLIYAITGLVALMAVLGAVYIVLGAALHIIEHPRLGRLK